MANQADTSFISETDEIITPEEYLRRQLEQEAEAGEALPGNFTECTFNLGPLNQPIYVCLTCKNDPSVEEKGQAGICYSCSISCHADHDLLELFNKRNFTCECGTKKFPIKCALERGIKSVPKDSCVDHLVDSAGWRKTVTSNKYTHNHDGLYCWCNKPYDPEVEEETLIQCLDCQDWFHQRCIGEYTPDEDADFICSTCVHKHPILLSYFDKDSFAVICRPKELVVDKVTDFPIDSTVLPVGVEPAFFNEGAGSESSQKTKRLHEGELLPPSSKPRLEFSEGDTTQSVIDCKRPICLKPNSYDNFAGKEVSIFAKKDWRNDLCRCKNCLDIYFDQNMTHLTEVEEVYTPEEDPNRAVSLYDAGLKALSVLPQEQAIQLVSQVDSLRSKLKEFLEPFAKSGKTVTKEDIQKYFSFEKRA